MSESSAIDATAVAPLLSAIASKGGDAKALVARFGVWPGSNDAGVWPLSKLTALLEAAASESGDPLFGLTLGKAYDWSSMGPLARLLSASPTGADALSKLADYFPSYQSNTHFAFSISGDVARLNYCITDPTVKFRRQDALFTIALEHSMLAELIGMDARPLRVDFQHLPDPGAEAGAYRAFFNCDVRFGRKENAIYFPMTTLRAPGVHADPHSSAKLEAELVDSIRLRDQHLDLSTSIEAWMTSALSAGMRIDMESAASDFGTSLRSFQRRLSESGINYLALRNKVRCQIAVRLVRLTSMPMTSIAHYLGYSETSGFCRHFKNMCGTSPSQLRLQPALSGRTRHPFCKSPASGRLPLEAALTDAVAGAWLNHDLLRGL